MTAAATIQGRLVEFTNIIKEMTDGAEVADLAEAFVLARNVHEAVDEGVKLFSKQIQAMSNITIPEALMDAKLTNFTTASGYRVSVSTRMSASFIDKEKGFAWLQENGLGDIIVPTVNTQTLGVSLKDLFADEGIEPPDDVIKVSPMRYTSVTKTKGK